MPKEAFTLSDVREPTLTVVCEPTLLRTSLRGPSRVPGVECGSSHRRGHRWEHCRRVGKDQVGALIAEKRRVRVFVASIAADQPVTPPPATHRRRDRCVAYDRNFIFRGPSNGSLGAPSAASSNMTSISNGKTGRLNIEAQIDQSLELNCQNLPIPATVKRQLVIRQDIGLSLRRAEVR
jgi:hypothetical protein